MRRSLFLSPRKKRKCHCQSAVAFESRTAQPSKLPALLRNRYSLRLRGQELNQFYEVLRGGEKKKLAPENESLVVSAANNEQLQRFLWKVKRRKRSLNGHLKRERVSLHDVYWA